MLLRAAPWLRTQDRLPEIMSAPQDGDDDRRIVSAGIDPQQLDTVYRVEAPKLIRLLKRKVWAEDERRDIVQEAFTRLAESKSGAVGRNPGAYLQGIIRHLLADRVRRWSRAQSITAVEIQTGDQALAPDTAFEINQLRERYRAAVDALPARTREVYWLHRVEELPYSRIAEKCGISVRTVEWHIAQAIMRISKSISADG